MKKAIILFLILCVSGSFLSAQECLDVKFKLRGYFYVGSSITDSISLGGFYENTRNRPKEINNHLMNISSLKNLTISVQKDSLIEFEKGISGFKVFILNKTDSIVKLTAQDSRIDLKRQVFYNGKWKDIEYLPRSWCGNSYHSVSIKPNEYWDLKAPCLKGKILAKFRFELYVNEKISIYSNEFEGSFNRSQLKKEQGYKPKGLMDPYNN